MNKCIVILSVFIFGIIENAIGQTASISRGCVPLDVDFISPTLREYYWDFGNGNTSILQNPKHVYNTPGTYTVSLKEGVNGAVIGQIQIKAFAPPIIEIIATPQGGCSPLTVNFSTKITLDPDVKILGYEWTFGDGASSNSSAPNHRYTNAKEYNVGLTITTDAKGCDKPELREKLIKVEGVDAKFSLDKNYDCLVPATFKVTSVSPAEPGNIYIWNVDGIDQFVHNIQSFTINRKGSYIVSFKVRNAAGCETSFRDTVIVGPPNISLAEADTVCADKLIQIINNTNAPQFNWKFGQGASFPSSQQKSPFVRFTQGGLIEINLRASTDSLCFSDTTFFILVEKPDATFTMDPKIACTNPISVNLKAFNRNMKTYIYNDSIIVGPDFDSLILCPKRDSFHTNRLDTFIFKLRVLTHSGCVDTSKWQYFVHRKPDAHFVPNKTSGCAPLDIIFTDSSKSHIPIQRWTWIFGDGQTETRNDKLARSHTYQNPGEYYVKLIIENTDGCIDTSFGVWIYVGSPITPTFTLDRKEICLNDSVRIEITNQDARIDGRHISTDDFRFNHCWVGTSATHGFATEPGTFDVSLMIDYNGCISERIEKNAITVKGANADIGYMVNCSTPNDLMFNYEGKFATFLEWSMGDGAVIQQDSFTHHYDTTGTYWVKLTARDDNSGCKEDVDSVQVFVKNIKAILTMPDTLCDNHLLVLDASKSIDVYKNCYAGYLWMLPDSRPREVNKDTIHHVFYKRGPQELQLIVEDINGCLDTFTQHLVSFGIDPKFKMDKNLICYPSDVLFNDLSTGDTTIVNWDWSFGSSQKDVNFRFTSGSPNIRIIQLTVEDAIGCMDTAILPLRIYKPRSIPVAFPNGVCVGGDIQFFTTQYFDQGSYLKYVWDFGDNQLDTLQNPKRSFSKAEENKRILLKYTEAKSGCMDTASVVIDIVDFPVADFTSNVDSLSAICHPKTINFFDNTKGGGSFNYSWTIGNLTTSTLKNPSETLPKGTTVVTLVANSIYGCSDSISKSYTLIGPSGNFEVSDSLICLGDKITFTLKNPVDVEEIIWDFKDGTTEINKNVVEHQYLKGTKFITPTLTLYSKNRECDLVDSVFIEIADIHAFFKKLDTLPFCEGIVFIEDSTANADEITWDYGGGTKLNEFGDTTELFYRTLGNKIITLHAHNSEFDCTVSFSDTVTLDPAERFFDFPNVFSPNGDMVNDYFIPELKMGVDSSLRNKIEILQFKVYNRWGNLIYNNEDRIKGWDGRNKNEDAPPEVYAYFIQVNVIGCRTYEKKGNVTLVR